MRPLLTLVALVATISACSAPPVEDGDPGDTSADAVTVGAGTACNRAKVLASVTGARKTVLQRGFKWLDDDVPYSQSRTHEGYRTDCSGFVSMCWDTGTSFTTAIYSSGGGGTTRLGSFDELLPGDAIVRNGHIMLFAGWQDNNHTAVCALEQASTASDMQFRPRTLSSLRGQGYKPIRSKKLGAGGTTDTSEPSEEPTTEEEATNPEDEGAEPPPEERTPAEVEQEEPFEAEPPPPPRTPTTPVPPEEETKQPETSSPGAETAPETRAPKRPPTRKETSSAEGDDDDGDTSNAHAMTTSGCSVATTGSPGERGALSSVGLGLGVLAFVRRRRRR